MIGQTRGATPDGPTVAYLTVLYPATSHTFIHNEVIGLRERGISVRTFSLNGVDASSLLTDFERDEQRNTVEIKALGAGRLARIIGRRTLRNPLATLSTLRTAISGRGLDLGARLKAIFQVGEALVLFDECDRAGITHVHAHFGQAPANVAWFATEYAHRIGLDEWSFSFSIHGPQDCLAEGDATLGAKVAAAELVVPVSDFTAAQLIRRIDPAQWSKVDVVRCGIEHQSCATSTDTTSDTASATSRRRDDTVLMVARLSPEKGHLVAIEAIAELRRRGTDVRLRLVGPGDPDATVMPAARQHGVGDLIEVVGPLPPHEVAAEMRSATVFALPSFAEGLPIVLMEAMSNGCPVVATGISGIPELIHDGDDGRLVPPARSDLLADALGDLIGDPAERARLAANAHRTVRELHDGERQIDTLLATFERAGALRTRTQASR